MDNSRNSGVHRSLHLQQRDTLLVARALYSSITSHPSCSRTIRSFDLHGLEPLDQVDPGRVPLPYTGQLVDQDIRFGRRTLFSGSGCWYDSNARRWYHCR